MHDNHLLAVVGGGVIGLTIAWRAAVAGHRVSLFDPTPGRGASWVAGGMLAPVTEAWPGEEGVLELGEESLRRWLGFAADLRAAGGEPGLAEHGTIVAALDSADAEQLDVLANYLGSLGRDAELLSRRELRANEPGLGGAVRRGLLVPGDLAVDNRALLRALHAAAVSAGVRFIAEEVTELQPGSVRTAQSGQHRFARVVLSAGAFSARLHPELAQVLRPLKGEILRLRARRGTLPPPAHTVRALVAGRPIYLVPRSDGELVLGATQYEAGFDQQVTAGGVRELLDGAERIFPGVTEYELVETAAGLRAGSVDNMPAIGELSDGVIVAAGHHRNGLLLAPVTADTVLAVLDGARVPHPARQADPARFVEPPARSAS